MAVARTQAKFKVSGYNAGGAKGSFAPLQPHTWAPSPHYRGADADALGSDCRNFIRAAWYWVFAVNFLIHTVNDSIYHTFLRIGLMDAYKVLFAAWSPCGAALYVRRF